MSSTATTTNVANTNVTPANSSTVPLIKPNTTTTTTTTNNNIPGGAFFSWIWFIFLIIYFFIWIISGVSAFVASFICLGYNGSFSDKLIGISIAVLFGPLYWLYFSLNKNYCYKNVVINDQMSDF